MVRVFGQTLLGFAVALVASGTGTAQNQAFDEGVKLYRLGKSAEALAMFEQVLADDPSHEQAFEVWRKTDQAVWQALLVRNDEISKIAQHLLTMATLGNKERSRDGDAIDALVEQATSGDYGERSKAQMQLNADHGEFAVPALVAKLGDADDDQGQIYAMQALERMARTATLPLVQAMSSSDDRTRRNVAAVLFQISDERAAAAMAAAASGDSSDSVRMTAQRAIVAIGRAGSAADLHMADARQYLSRSGVRPGERSDVVWGFDGDQLVYADAPAAVYHLELAKNSAHAALELAPGSDAARALLARAYLAEAAAITESLAANPDDESLAGWADQVHALRMMAVATGLGTVRAAVADAIAAGMTATAVTGIELLAGLENQNTVGNSPLVPALSSQDSRIAYAAALAVAAAGGGAVVPAAARVVDNLGRAVTEEAIMTIKVIDRSPATERAVMNAGFQRGFQHSVSASAVGAMDDIYSAPVDVVVISETLPDARPEAIIGLIRGDSRMSNTKILMVAADTDAASETFGDRVDGFIEGPLSSDNLKSAVEEALSGVEPGVRRARADRVAVMASGALAQLAGSVDLQPALANLAAQLDRDDAVAVPAAQAIGGGGNMNQVPALMAALGSDTASLDVKVACADAAGEIFARAGVPDQSIIDQLMAIVTSGADQALRLAAVGALGKASLGADAEASLLKALRVAPQAGMDG